jgi:DNA-binding MarR family transcriptional regulator
MTDELLAVDDALVRLRRLWSTTPRRADGDAVEMSSVLVVEACARGAATGAEVTVGDVARFADVEHSTASRLIDRAARQGLLEKVASARDARSTALALTAAGRELRRRSVAFRTGWLGDVLQAWAPADVSDLARLLSRFAEDVTDHGGPGPVPRS